MPIDSTHPSYDNLLSRWLRCRHCYEGEDTVKDQGVLYLPKLSKKQTDDEYQGFKDRADFFDATQRTVQGLVGVAVRKEPKIELPSGLSDLVDLQLIKLALREMFITGRLGVLVDMPTDGSGAPYLNLYTAEEIINWRTDDDGNLLWVVLSESVYEQEDDDPYKLVAVQQYRELTIDSPTVAEDEQPGPVGYIQRVWRATADGKSFEIVDEVQPIKQGSPLDEIPFFLGGVDGLGAEPTLPPILPLANANISLYRKQADYNHGLHYTALPTPYVTGYQQVAENETLSVGSGTAWLIPNPEAKVGMLEFEGHGLDDSLKAIELLEKRLAVLGARLLEGQRVGVEAAETARIRQAGEVAAVSAVVTSTEAILKAAAEFAVEWSTVSGTVEIKLNQDFLDVRLSSADLAELVKAWQSGAMPFKELWRNLQRGELASEEIDAETAKAMIEAEKPDLSGEPLPLGEGEE
jgi:hypothetical protein